MIYRIEVAEFDGLDDFLGLFAPAEDGSGVAIEATVRVTARTGVEMEALTAVSVAALTVYDMCKAVDRGMRLEEIALHEKSGGKSGTWLRTPPATRPRKRAAK